ncbi:MAG TPA: cadmium-translocating P-type ATPase [Candidatus Galloscillospira stercoripullorum]|nr:cadmium-translocating P-type ATPase [Candidatus Galloscillospira stercoripullorum]
MDRRQKRTLARILISAALLILAALLPLEGPLRLAAFLVPYAVIGHDVLWEALEGIAHGQVFDENFLMALATVGAIGTGEYPEAVFVMLFYQVGELFQSYAVGKSRQSIAALMDIRPDWANVERDGALAQVDPEEVAVGEVIVVRPGERIPLDGEVLEGTSAMDTAALTGESLPRTAGPGDEVISGCVNLSGVLRIRVSKVFGDSTVAKILDLVENASSKKARAEQFITRFARYYTPAVVLAAVVLAVLPPLLSPMDWRESLNRALTFLVISCPCALVISVPLSFFGGIGGASRQGILVKGGNYLEALAKARVVVFDKTGTLTQGVFRVTEVRCSPEDRTALLETAALAELHSSHPIARALREAWGKPLDPSRVREVEERSGRGVRSVVDGTAVLAGSRRLLEEAGLTLPADDGALPGTVVHVAVGNRYLGCLLISDQLRPEAPKALSALKAEGVEKTVLLTGDSLSAGEAAAKELGIDQVCAQLLPGDKVEQVERLLSEKGRRGKLVYVGDGINDTPVLSRADVGIAMGGIGSDAAIEAADVVLMDDDLSKLPLAVSIARRTLAIAKQNIVFALGVKLGMLLLVAAGFASMWMGVFADVGVAVLAILNAMRALKVPKAS